MSCNYCDGQRDLLGGTKYMGCAIESIRIKESVSCPPPQSQVHIFVGMGSGGAWTKPINFCPMCGARLTEGDNR